MNEDYLFALFILSVGLTWSATFLQSDRLFYKFRIRHPDHASEIPFAFTSGRHPEKLFYFFRKTSMAILKTDPVIWSLRQQVKFLLILSMALPALAFLILFSIALYAN